MKNIITYSNCWRERKIPRTKYQVLFEESKPMKIMQILDCRAGAVGWAGGKTEASVVRTEETAKCKKIKKIIWVAEPVRPGGLAARTKLRLGAL